MRYSLGTKEIIAIVLGTLGFIGFSILFEGTEVSELLGRYIQVRVLWLAVLSALFGPIAGVIIGAAGRGLFDVLMHTAVSYEGMFSMAMIGLVIGKYAKKYGIRDGLFDWKCALEFNATQLMAGIISWVFAAPFMDFLVNGSNLLEAEWQGMQMMVGNAALILVVGTPVLMLINQWMRHDKKRIAQKLKNRKDDGLLRTS